MALTHVQLRGATLRDPILAKVLDFTPTMVPSEELKPFARKSGELTVEADCILWGTRSVIPTCHREVLLQGLHKGHPGACHMKAVARSHIWWPNIDKDIEKMARSCVACSQVKSAPSTTHGYGPTAHGGIYMLISLDIFSINLFASD